MPDQQIPGQLSVLEELATQDVDARRPEVKLWLDVLAQRYVFAPALICPVIYDPAPPKKR